LVFSAAEDRFMDVGPELCTTFPPLGTMPSEQDIDRTRTKSVVGFKGKYTLNEWKLMGSGDILFLYTDGLSEHARGREPYFPQRLEEVFRSVKHRSSRDIVAAVKDDLLAFADPNDDITLVAIKRA
jgi:serine phosphatase RsbU (regulator of sigma subunit)